MLENKDEVLKKLDEIGISYDVTHHKAVHTIEDMEQLGMDNIDKVIKNLFIRDNKKTNYYLVLLQKDKTVNLKKLQEKLNGRKLSFGSEEDLYKYLGLYKGAVTPLGILNDKNHFIKVVMDKQLDEFDFIGVHPNDNTATVWIKVNDIKDIIKSNGNEIKSIRI